MMDFIPEEQRNLQRGFASILRCLPCDLTMPFSCHQDAERTADEHIYLLHPNIILITIENPTPIEAQDENDEFTQKTKRLIISHPIALA